MAPGGSSASASASTAASAKSSPEVRSCLPNFVTPTPMTATRRIAHPPDAIITRAVTRCGYVSLFLVPRGLRGFNGVMLTEEALILLATLGASGLLVLGVAELAWPTKPRTQPRRTRPTVPPPRPESPAVTPATTLTDIEPVRPAEEHEPFAEPSVAAMPAAETLVAPPPDVEVAPVARVASVEPEAPRPQVLPVDTCLAMYKDGRYAEVVSLGSAALEVHARLAAVSGRPHEAAALLDLVGLSKQE